MSSELSEQGFTDRIDSNDPSIEATTAAAHALSNLNRCQEAYPPFTVSGGNHEACGYPFPPNYRIPNTKPTRTGRWTLQEHKIFLKGVANYGRTWTKVAEMVGTRSAGQVRSHAQKFDLRLAKELRMLDQRASDGASFDDLKEGGSEKGNKEVEPPPRKRGGGRPKGSTKEKIQERATNAALSQLPQTQRFHVFRPESGEPYRLDAQYHFREQQAAQSGAYGFHPHEYRNGPPPCTEYGDLPYRNPPPSASEYYPPHEGSDWRTPAAIDTLLGRFNVNPPPSDSEPPPYHSYPPPPNERYYSGPSEPPYYLGSNERGGLKRAYDSEPEYVDSQEYPRGYPQSDPRGAEPEEEGEREYGEPEEEEGEEPEEFPKEQMLVNKTHE